MYMVFASTTARVQTTVHARRLRHGVPTLRRGNFVELEAFAEMPGSTEARDLAGEAFSLIEHQRKER